MNAPARGARRTAAAIVVATATALLFAVLPASQVAAALPGANGLIWFADASGLDTLASLDPSTGERRRFGPVFITSGSSISASPDGRLVAYGVAETGGNRIDVHVMPAAGGASRNLTEDSPNVIDQGPAFCANGRIVFASTRSGRGHLYSMDADGSDVRPITTGDSVLDEAAKASCAGTTVAFMRDTRIPCEDGSTGMCRSSHVWVTSEGGGYGSQVTDSTSDGFAYARDPEVSPDGARIVFVGRRWGAQTAALYTVGTGGGTPVPLLDLGEDGGSDPAWSPDGDSILFERADRVWQIDVSGGAEREVLAARDGRDPAWAPAVTGSNGDDDPGDPPPPPGDGGANDPAPPPPGPPAPPGLPAADGRVDGAAVETAPSMSVRGKSLKLPVQLTARTEPLTAVVGGVVRLPSGKAQSAAGLRLRLRSARATIEPGTSRRVVLRLKGSRRAARRATRRIRRAARRGKKVRAVLSIALSDAAGNQVVRRPRIRLVG